MRFFEHTLFSGLKMILLEEMTFRWLEKFGVGGKEPEKNVPAGFAGSEKELEHSEEKRYASPPEIKSPDEEILISRRETKVKSLEGGTTHPLFVELKDDGKGVFKEAAWERERAVYLIDRFLGLELVPPTVVRQVNGILGSLQRFIPDATLGGNKDMETHLAACKTDMIKLWLLDIIIDNGDRNYANFLIKNSKVYAIDNGYSLNYGNKKDSLCYADFEKRISLYCGYKRFPGENLPVKLAGQMKKFLENTAGQKILQELLAELIGEDNARACLKRIVFVTKMIAEKGAVGSAGEDYLAID